MSSRDFNAAVANAKSAQDSHTSRVKEGEQAGREGRHCDAA